MLQRLRLFKNYTQPSFFNNFTNNIDQIQLITSFKRKNIISGLMTKSMQEKQLFTADTVLGKEYRAYEKAFYGKVVMNFAGKIDLKENSSSISKMLLEGFKDVFGSLEKISKTKDLINIISGKKEITLIQHNINVLFCSKKFTYKTLEEFAGTQIDCSSYKNNDIAIQTFSEVFFIKKTLLENNVDIPYRKIFLINPDNLASLPFFYNHVECQKVLGQKNCDFVIVEIDSSTGELSRKYVDVKTHGLFSIEINHISLCPETQKDILKELNNLKVSFRKLINQINDFNHPITRFWNDVLNPIYLLSKEEINYFDKYIKIIKQLKMIRFNKDLELLNIGLSASTGKDFFFDEFYDNVLRTFLKRYDDRQMQRLFPTDCVLDESAHQMILLDFLTNYMSQETRDLVQSNLTILGIM